MDIKDIQKEPENFVTSKIAVLHVLAGLIQDPLIFADNNYNFSVEDFPERFHQIVFGAVEYLAKNGMEKISYLDIDQTLKNYPVQYNIFTNNKGIEYIQNAIALYEPKKFDYYYHTLKKYSLVNKLKLAGIDTRDIYDPEIIDPLKGAEMQANFDNMSVNDILLSEETKIIMLKEQFGSNSDRVENHAGDGLRALKERLKETPDIGLPMLSPKLTTILRGQRLGCLFMESGGSGFGKSRRAAGEACHLAIPKFYDVVDKEWKETGLSEPVLCISTELEEYECQQMWMACVSGVNESNIKDGRYNFGEEERVDEAIELIEKSELYFVSITNYDIDDIVNTIKKYKQIHGIRYVFFDYLGESLKITSSVNRMSKGQGLRTDQVLLSFSSALKDTAKTLGIFIQTYSQLSGDYRNAKQVDESYLRSAKSIADKIDSGLVLIPVGEQDEEIINTYCAKGFELRPNFVLHIYKVRAGSWQNIKLYVNYDRGTCQMHDCFAVDREGQYLPIADTNIEILLDSTREVPAEWDGDF